MDKNNQNKYDNKNQNQNKNKNNDQNKNKNNDQNKKDDDKNYWFSPFLCIRNRRSYVLRSCGGLILKN